MNRVAEVIIIGGGVIGCSIASLCVDRFKEELHQREQLDRMTERRKNELP